ncbi:MAG: type II secretion system minor pseudopilin GspJ [Pseudomonadota bacterium]
MNKSRGFTLAEMLVALFAFAVLSAAATSILTYSLQSKEALSKADDELRAFQIARAVMKSDFGQVALRPVRDPFGGFPGVSFAGGELAPPGVLIAFVRRGWENPDGLEQRASLQYVEYLLVNDALVRRSRARLDPTLDTPVSERVLLEGVADASISFLQSDQWSDRWETRGSLSGRTPQALAIEMDLADLGPVRQVFMVTGEAG